MYSTSYDRPLRCFVSFREVDVVACTGMRRIVVNVNLGADVARRCRNRVAYDDGVILGDEVARRCRIVNVTLGADGARRCRCRLRVVRK